MYTYTQLLIPSHHQNYDSLKKYIGSGTTFPASYFMYNYLQAYKKEDLPV